MRVLVNGLSVGSLSGAHVLFGHLRQLAGWSAADHEFVVLHHPGQASTVRSALPCDNVHTLEAPRLARHWTARTAWESLTLPGVIRSQSADIYFSPSGTILPTSPIPQVCLAQNPWCMVRELHRSLGEKVKAAFQRSAYRRAVRDCRLMVYNSQHMRSLYHRNAEGIIPGPDRVVHQGINPETFDIAAESRVFQERRPRSIVSVSVMAHWKGADTLIQAISLLKNRGLTATLDLVGPWPDAAYESKIRAQIGRLGLDRQITVRGKVSVDQLHEFYATSQVFCLMSACESFGIPALEAQAFGTPVVGTDTTAMSEIGGDGGLYCAPGNVSATADLLERLLSDQAEWQQLSENAVANAQNFHWENCSRPLMSMFELASEYEIRAEDAATPAR